MKIGSHITLACAFLLLSFPLALTGQSQKIGYINTNVILRKMPEYKSIKQQLRNLSQKWRHKLERMKQKIEKLKEEFNAKKILYTDEVRKRKKQKIQQAIKERKQFLKQKFGPRGAYFKTQKRLLKPIQKKIYKAVISVSKQMGIDFVFDRAKGSVLFFAQEKWNLNDEILSELGITLNQ